MALFLWFHHPLSSGGTLACDKTRHINSATSRRKKVYPTVYPPIERVGFNFEGEVLAFLFSPSTPINPEPIAPPKLKFYYFKTFYEKLYVFGTNYFVLRLPPLSLFICFRTLGRRSMYFFHSSMGKLSHAFS